MVVRGRHLALVLVLTASCAKNPSPSPDAAPAMAGTTPRVAHNANVISHEELQDPSIAGTDAMTAIRQLRPAFFRTRGPQSFSNATAGQLQVSQDFGPLQPMNALSSMDVRTLYEVRYLNANEAQTRFGINANGGPVVVLLTSHQ